MDNPVINRYPVKLDLNLEDLKTMKNSKLKSMLHFTVKKKAFLDSQEKKKSNVYKTFKARNTEILKRRQIKEEAITILK